MSTIITADRTTETPAPATMAERLTAFLTAQGLTELPEDQVAAILAKLDAARDAGYAARRDEIIVRAGDAGYNDGRQREFQAVLTRAYGRFPALTGRWITVEPLSSKSSVSAHIGTPDKGETVPAL